MWRVIGLEAYPAAVNMAIDEAIGDELRHGRSDPTIRLYTWRSPAVSIGYFQCIRDELDLDACQLKGVDHVRRRTGGGAVYHDPQGEITYSVIGPESCFPNGIRESYQHICAHIISGLHELGIASSFRPINDVTVNGRKISGSAQTRRQGVLTQHGTILFRLDREAMFSVLKPSKVKLADKPFNRFEDGVTSVSELCDATKDDLYTALLRGFTRDKEWRFGMLTDREQLLVSTLKDQYESDRWNFSR